MTLTSPSLLYNLLVIDWAASLLMFSISVWLLWCIDAFNWEHWCLPDLFHIKLWFHLLPLKKNLQINPQDLLRCSSVINATRLICKYLQRKPCANTTTPEMERSYINSTWWPTFSAAECGQKSLKAAVVPCPFCLTSGEIFIIPHRQHGDARSPLIYSDPCRRRHSAVSIREDKEEKCSR